MRPSVRALVAASAALGACLPGRTPETRVVSGTVTLTAPPAPVASRALAPLPTRRRAEVVPCPFHAREDEFKAGSQGLYLFMAPDENHGYRDAAGAVVIAPRFFLATEFSPGGVAAVIGPTDGAAFIDARGQVIAQALKFDNGPDYFAEGLARIVGEHDRIGFLDECGQVAIEPQWDFAWPFQEGLAVVCQGCQRVPEGEHVRMDGGRWGYIDARGRVAIELVFEHAFPFDDGEARVTRDGRQVTIDHDGHEVDQTR